MDINQFTELIMGFWGGVEFIKRTFLSPLKDRYGWDDTTYGAIVWGVAGLGGAAVAFASNINLWQVAGIPAGDSFTGALLAGFGLAAGSEVTHRLVELLVAVGARFLPPAAPLPPVG